MADGEQSEADKLAAAVRNAKASWQDEHGVRGPQPTVIPTTSSELEQRSDAPTGAIIRQEESRSSTEETPSSTVPLVRNMFGFANGARATFYVLMDRAPTPDP